ncbi:MAG: T9SS C-terminal target domain-containing protein [Bacteroidetes bacterium]|nr:MAG: T9SS C-terminal target domain-containing protein [Bacteroidota bacterium]
MNFKFVHTLPILLLAAFILAFSNGPAGGDGGNGPRMQDRSGSPYAHSQGPNCAACHNNGSFNPGLTIELLEDGNAVAEYVPGQTYTLRYTVEANAGSPNKYGVQSVVLTTSDDANAGTFGDAPSGTRVAPIDDRSYFEHSTGSNDNTFEIEWTAPEEELGDITIYASGIAANGNGTNGGDNGTAATLTVAQTINVSSSSLPELLPIDVTIFPNPVKNVLNLELKSSIQGTYQMDILDIQGTVLASSQIALDFETNRISENVNHLSPGIYLVRITDGQKLVTGKMIKQ